MENNIDYISPIIEVIKPYDPIDLLAKVAVLQLCPENASQTIRLEALAHAINCVQYQPNKPKVSKHKLAQILNEPPLGKGFLQTQEDPTSNAFTEAFTFYGGSYIVFPGQVTDATYILQNLNQAIFLSEKFNLHKNFKNKIYAMNLVLLSISDTMARGIGLKRNMLPVMKSDSFYIPKDIDQKTSIVTFTLREMNELLNSLGLSYGAIESFVQNFGLLTPVSYSAQNSPLHSRPLIRFEDRFIVSEPWMLLASLRQHILLIAKEFNLLDLLFSEYIRMTCYSVYSSLDRLGYEKTEYEFEKPSLEMELCESVWNLDTDKVLYVAIVFDDFRNYKGDDAFENQVNNNQGKIIDDRLADVEHQLFQATTNLEGILFLIVQVGIGRSSIVGLSFDKLQRKPIVTILSASELYLLSVLYHSDRFLLYKFAKAQQVIRDSTKVFAWSTLDEFALYRENHFSYYLSDDVRPKFINITPGTELSIHKDFLEKVDLHAVRSNKSNGWIEVENCYRIRSCPIYTPIHLNPHELALIVEFPNITFWITTDIDSNPKNQITDSHSLFAIVDLTSYWLWQFECVFPGCLTETEFNDPMHFKVINDDGDILDKSVSRKVNNPFISISSSSGNELQIKIKAEIVNLINTPDNSGELEIVNYILKGFCKVLLKNGFIEQAKKIINHLKEFTDLERAIPRKKKVLFINAGVNPTMLPGNPFEFRKIQEADRSDILDEEGEYLKTKFHLKPEPIPSSQHVQILNSIVDYLFKKLVNIISNLNPDHLLDFLVTHYEAIVFERSNRRITIPTQLACFSTTQELVEQLMQELPEIDEAALCCRFLIEYVVAQPPNGTKPISFEVYDQLMSISAEIIARANQSDMAKYGLFNFELAYLESGRLGFNRTEFNSKVDIFQNHRSADEIVLAENNFHRWWKEKPNINPDDYPSVVKELNNAFEAEFRIKFSDINKFVSELGDFSLDLDQSQLKTMEFSNLVCQLSNILNWNQTKTIQVIDFLSLEPRVEFLKPPLPFSLTDVYPWRMSRGLSYMRRPLLVVMKNDQKIICWGERHLFASFDYLLQATVSGRLQDRYHSKEMREFIGKNSISEGEDFNNKVYEACVSLPGVIALRKVKKICGKRIGHPGNDLGDIDVLAFFPKKRIIAIIECKNLEIARNAVEMSHELVDLFTGNDNRESTITKHYKRSEWIKNNLSLVLDYVGIHDCKKWRIEPVLVVSSEMMTSAFYESPIPVYQIDRFSSEYLQKYL